MSLVVVKTCRMFLKLNRFRTSIYAVRSTPPNCVYLQRTEQRYGDGDGIFTVSEQTRAVDALYNHIRGEQNFTGPERRVRLGVELSF